MPRHRTTLAHLPRERPYVALLLAILGVELVGGAGGLFTASGVGGWYETLVRPALAPPNWVFGPVWTALYAMMGTALWLVWRRFETQPGPVRTAVGVFAVHLLVNLSWSAAFFGLRDPGLGLAVIGGLWTLIVATIWTFARVDRRAAALLVPYLLWVSFAAYLNYRIWLLN
jgi:benzodiazapine receptor